MAPLTKAEWACFTWDNLGRDLSLSVVDIDNFMKFREKMVFYSAAECREYGIPRDTFETPTKELCTLGLFERLYEESTNEYHTARWERERRSTAQWAGEWLSGRSGDLPGVMNRLIEKLRKRGLMDRGIFIEGKWRMK